MWTIDIEIKKIEIIDFTFRSGFIPPLVQLNLFGACIALVSSGKFHARRVSEFEIESCSKSSS